MAATGLLLVGCYTLQPIRSAKPVAGTRVALDINDAGRVALGGSMGPEIAQVEGRLLESSNGDYHIAVSAVRLLRGSEQIWTGEEVRISSDYIGTTYERRFSRGRTIALSAVTVGALTAFALSRDLIGSGSIKRPPVIPDTLASLRLRP